MNMQIKTIEREQIDPDNLYGFVVGESKELLMILVADDFALDGYQIVKKSDITSNKGSSGNKYCTAIMKKENMLKNLAVPDVDLDSWKTALSSLKSDDQYVIVEDEVEGDFFIGPITRIYSKSVSIHDFDGVGKWIGVENVKYEHITTVRFSCRYIDYHRKYLKPNKPMK
jgi:hypothetical protein